MVHAQELLIDRIYEAAAFPEVWPDVLEGVARVSHSVGAVALLRRSDDWLGWQVSKPFEKMFLDYLASGVGQRSQATPRLIAAEHAGFLSEADIFTSEEWAADPFRSEWCRKWQFDHGIATAIQVPSGDFLVFHIQRRAGAPAYNHTDRERLDSLRPHLARAGLLATRWQLARLQAATEALGLVGLPALVLDRSGRVLAANMLIQGLTKHLHWLPRDRIAIADPIAQQLLREALAALSNAAAHSVRSFAARPMNGETAVVVHLIPTAGQARELFNGGLAILVVTPVTAAEAPDVALIRGLFDLTPNEARVARGIVQGLTIDEIAARSGVERETIRTQLKGVFAKTGTKRQAEIASLLATIPKFPSVAPDRQTE